MDDRGEARTPRNQISAGERREQLVAAALRVMRRDGIAAASTRAICAEAGMPHGAFHYCFHSKKELYAALLASDIEIDLGAAWPHISPDASPFENIRTLLLAFWSQIETDPDAQLVLFDLGSLALRDPELQELPQHEHAASLEKATGYITRLADEARLDFAQDERVLAELVLDTLNGVAWSWLAHRDNDLARQSLERFASLAASFARTSSEHTS
ncbi:TetR/AcrR family transcriptional regulator [Micrococcus luteus]|uniref:TetR/AcrR family transcriptional regulator n=1 Tax=Micrococcus luteus TaxID=1270 RepID=UPI003F817461